MRGLAIVALAALAACSASHEAGEPSRPPAAPAVIQLPTAVIDDYGPAGPDLSIAVERVGRQHYSIEVRANGDIVFHGISGMDAIGDRVVGSAELPVRERLLRELADAHFFAGGRRPCVASGFDTGTGEVVVATVGDRHGTLATDCAGADGDALAILERDVSKLADVSALLVDSHAPPAGRFEPYSTVRVQVSTTGSEVVDRVVRSRMGIYKACYQKELNRTPGVHGNMHVDLQLDPEGRVASATGGGLGNEAIEGCTFRNLKRLKFPAGTPAGPYKLDFTFSVTVEP